MKRTARALVFVVSAATFAGCASHGSDVDSESHFQCGEDGDCRGVHGRSICVSGWCEVPGIRQTVLNESPGAAVDCTTEWPPTTLRFETAETDPFQSFGAWGSSGPHLNRNGTVIVGFTRPEDTPPRRGHLVRWAGDTVSRFEQTTETTEAPRAVSCDGMTIVGEAGDSAYRWSATDGFALLASAGAPTDQGVSIPMALSPDGSTVWGVYRSYVDSVHIAVRWQNGLAERLFTLDQAASSMPGWSAEGTFVGFTEGRLFTQSAGTLPAFPETPVAWREGSAVSADGKVVAGTDTQFHPYLWSSDNQLEALADRAGVLAVTPNGIAVGGMDDADAGPDYDFVWDRKHGARRLREVLATHGLQLPSTTWIDQCTDISADGRVITGISVDETGAHFFRAILPAGAFD